MINQTIKTQMLPQAFRPFFAEGAERLSFGRITPELRTAMCRAPEHIEDSKFRQFERFMAFQLGLKQPDHETFPNIEPAWPRAFNAAEYLETYGVNKGTILELWPRRDITAYQFSADDYEQLMTNPARGTDEIGLPVAVIGSQDFAVFSSPSGQFNSVFTPKRILELTFDCSLDDHPIVFFGPANPAAMAYQLTMINHILTPTVLNSVELVTKPLADSMTVFLEIFPELSFGDWLRMMENQTQEAMPDRNMIASLGLDSQLAGKFQLWQMQTQYLRDQVLEYYRNLELNKPYLLNIDLKVDSDEAIPQGVTIPKGSRAVIQSINFPEEGRVIIKFLVTWQRGVTPIELPIIVSHDAPLLFKPAPQETGTIQFNPAALSAIMKNIMGNFSPDDPKTDIMNILGQEFPHSGQPPHRKPKT